MAQKAAYEESASNVPDNLIARILATKDSMSEGERRIADYLLAHQANVSSLSQSELARLCQVSAPTVSRFCRKMGENSYRSFQLSFLRVQQTLHRLSAIEEDQPVSLDHVGETVEAILDNRIASLTLTLQGLDQDKLKAAAQIMAKARIVEFAAVGRSIPSAQYASYYYERIGISAPTSSYYEKLISCALTLDSRDVLVILSRSGWSGTLQQVAHAAHDKGATLVCITGNATSPLAQLSDFVFLVTSNNMDQDSLIGNTSMAELAIMETLYALTAAAKPDSQDCLAEFSRYIFSKVDIP